MNELAKIDQRFTGFFSAVALLYVARKMTPSVVCPLILFFCIYGPLLPEINELILALILGSNVNKRCGVLS